MQKISPFLWFNDNAEEAVNFYISIFKNSKILDVTRHGEVGPGTKGSAWVIDFELNGQRFIALNGGPHFKFTEAISFTVNCEGQAEIDFYWNAFLAAGGTESQCGWLKDKYGLSWQITPVNMRDLISTPEALGEMMKMKKLDIATLKAASSK